MNRRDILKKFFAGNTNTGTARGTGWQQPVVAAAKHFTAHTTVNFLNECLDTEVKAGFRLFDKKEGTDTLNAGINSAGHLFIGDTIISHRPVEERLFQSAFKLILIVIPLTTGKQYLKLKALDSYGNTLATLGAEKELHENFEAEVFTVYPEFVRLSEQSFINPNN